MRTIKFIFFIFLTFQLYSQDNAENLKITSCGFDNIILGMSSDVVKENLKKSDYFIYHNYTESLLPFSQSPIIECAGREYVENVIFYFDGDTLYSIELFLNRHKMDFWTIYTTLKKKYGKQSFLSPKKVKWEDENFLIVLERNLSLKFLDKIKHKSLIDKSLVDKSDIIKNKNKFLDKIGGTNEETK